MDTYEPISLTASTTLGNVHIGALLVVSAAAGLTLTLPAASGTGRTFDILVGTTVTSNSVIVQVASASDTMTGVCVNAADAGDAALAFETAATTDTITMNGTTTGGVKGDRIELIDAESGLWSVRVVGSATGLEATPFSAAV
jgi:hypothetical protein